MRRLPDAAALTTVSCSSVLAQQADYPKLEIKTTDRGGGVYLLTWQGGHRAFEHEAAKRRSSLVLPTVM